MLSAVLLVTSALLAGALNALAGGGTFLTFPALLYTGVPAVAANATSTVALLPGYLSGACGFRHRVGPAAGLGVPWQLVTSPVGGLVGSLLLLTTALFAVGDRLAVWSQRHAKAGTSSVIASLFVVSCTAATSTAALASCCSPCSASSA